MILFFSKRDGWAGVLGGLFGVGFCWVCWGMFCFCFFEWFGMLLMVVWGGYSMLFLIMVWFLCAMSLDP